MTTTITLSKQADRVAILIDGDVLTTVKDGDNLIGRTDRHLRAAKILRASGYTLTEGDFVAAGASLR